MIRLHTNLKNIKLCGLKTFIYSWFFTISKVLRVFYGSWIILADSNHPQNKWFMNANVFTELSYPSIIPVFEPGRPPPALGPGLLRWCAGMTQPSPSTRTATHWSGGMKGHQWRHNRSSMLCTLLPWPLGKNIYKVVKDC